MADKTQGKATRREVLAFIALQDEPMPSTMSFWFGTLPTIALDVDDAVAVGRWAELFGLDRDRTTSWITEDGASRSVTVAYGKWRGWPTRVEATTTTPIDAALDEGTSAKLREIAGGDQ